MLSMPFDYHLLCFKFSQFDMVTEVFHTYKLYTSEIVREYDQEIPQSQIADNPMASRGTAAQPSRDTKKTNQAKQPALSTASRRLHY